MGVDEARRHVAAVQVRRMRPVVTAHTGDPTVLDRDVALQNLPGQHLDDPSVFQNKVRLQLALGRVNQFTPVHFAPSFWMIGCLLP